MKKTIMLMLLVGCLNVFAKDLSSRKELLADIKLEVKKCAVQVVSTPLENNNSNVVGFKSICPTLVIVSNSEARLLIEGQWLLATIRESAESDGNDLDDLFITDSKGKILATKTNIPAFDSIIVAMSGDSNFENREESKN